MPLTWKVRCANERCRAKFAVGNIFWLLPEHGGQQLSPRDNVTPLQEYLPNPKQPFVLGKLADLNYRSITNQLVLPPSGGESEETV